MDQKQPRNGQEVKDDQDWRLRAGGHGFKRFIESFLPTAPWTSIKSAEWPPRPNNTGKHIDLGPLVSKTDAKLAYNAWKLADDTLEKAWKDRPDHNPSPEAEEPGLARNVYEHLMIFAVLPLNQDDAKKLFAEEGLNKTWDTAALIASMKDNIIDDSSIRGVVNWSTNAIKTELKERELSKVGKSEELQQRLIDDEIQKHCGVMSVSDLSHLGIKRSNKYILQPATNKAMTPIDMYTFAIHLSPYNPAYWLSRAYCHYQQGFFDLALGDAYRAQILCNTIEQVQDRFSTDGLHTQIHHAMEQHILVEPMDKDKYWSELITMMREPQGMYAFISTIQKTLLNIICLSLEALNCWDDFDSYHRQLAARTNRLYQERFVADLRKRVSEKAEKAWRKEKRRPGLFWFERHQGAVSAASAYPYEKDDILDLFQVKKNLATKLTEEIFQNKQEEAESSTAPSDICEVKYRPNLRLGVFAKKDIKKGELIHWEEPTIRGHLPARRLNRDRTKTRYVDDIRCENCKVEVDDKVRRPSVDDTRSEHSDDEEEEPYCTCAKHWNRNPSDKRGLMFCPSGSKEKTCVSVAYDLYHEDGCGRDWKWLYDTMRPNVWKWGQLEHISHSNEVHGTVTEITLLRRQDHEEPGLAPQEIDELLIMSGNSRSWRDSWFPFTMSANIIIPFDIVSFLGVNIFRDLTFDTWALQTVLRKLLVNAVPWDMKRRGDISAVHPKEEDRKLETPAEQKRRLMNGYSFEDWDPAFLNLYVLPGLNMFNHTCAGMQNAEWGYDTQILNRVIVWAHKDIRAGEEIRIRYQCEHFDSKNDARQILGGPCLCPNNEGHDHEEQMDVDEEDSDEELSSSSDSGDAGGGNSNPKRYGAAKESSGPRLTGFEVWKRRRGGGRKAKDKEEKEEEEDEVEEDDSDELPARKKQKYEEYAKVDKDRVAIRRLLRLEEELEENERRKFVASGAGSASVNTQARRKKEYVPMVPMIPSENSRKWVARERSALRKDRNKQRIRELAEEMEDHEMKEYVDVPQIARAPGEPLEIVPVLAPEYVQNVTHWDRIKRKAGGRRLT
ncbi:hypothetical protein N7509_007604 [Penicillium cosmopolitanum]|uniref:Histone-lysine N-methyltransferase SET5 n=1 Tax=Penicillium cosmopolitanum TaxID=1131564 RepID=A0A9W9VZB1_9EURO|nr:uncharacterized protein N7509_007604 [Penicillium cosmopolitanum]KAJ5392114.1 hypothetical protein N7509_007604 [Penicillium cosmopolitanum]